MAIFLKLTMDCIKKIFKNKWDGWRLESAILKTLETGEEISLPVNGKFSKNTMRQSFLVKEENCYQLTLTLKKKDLQMIGGWDKSGQLATVRKDMIEWAFAGCSIGNKIEFTAAATDGEDKVVWFKFIAIGN